MKKLATILIALLLLVGFTTQAYSAGPLSRPLQTGQTTQYDSQEDDGYYEKGIPHDYTVLTTGQHAGTTNIVINDNTYAHPNACVWNNRTGLMFAQGVLLGCGPADDGKLYWQQWTLVANSGTFDQATKTITAAAGTPYDTGALCIGRIFETDSVNNPGPFTVAGITTTVITTSEALVDEGPVAITFATVDDLVWNYVDQANSGSGVGGYTDWRLPNANELMSLIDFSTNNPCIDAVTFPSTPSSVHWVSTTPSNTSTAHAVRFDIPVLTNTTKKTQKFYVRLVRGGV